MFFSINRFFRTSTLVIVSLGVVVFQPAQANEGTRISNLAPMPEPTLHKGGTVIQGITNGKPSTEKLVSTNGNIETWQDNEGCVLTRDMSLGYFSPDISWKNCGKTGSLRVHGKSGNIWPLKVGNLVEYTVKGRNVGGRSWSANRRCKVDKQVRITTHTGTHDTFKVICRTKWYTRIWYMSPKIGASVKYIKRPSSLGRNKSTDFELTRIVGR